MQIVHADSTVDEHARDMQIEHADSTVDEQLRRQRTCILRWIG